jgi:hypothetical protein
VLLKVALKGEIGRLKAEKPVESSAAATVEAEAEAAMSTATEAKGRVGGIR